jgi:biotin transport system substrate-specific component
MPKTTSQSAILSLPQSWLVREVSLVIGASLLMAVCARISVPLPFTPVPLTLGNFAVLVIGMVLGSRRGMAALLVYLAEGAAGLPVFSPAGPGGVAQLLGPTGGYLMAYPLAAFLAGWVSRRLERSFSRLALAALCGEVVLFAGGVTWLMALTQVSLKQAAWFGLYPFLFAEIIKVLSAAALALRLPPLSRNGSVS